MNPPPLRSTLVKTTLQATESFAEWLMSAYRSADSVTQSGTTANRPTVSLWIGRRYYDTTLGLPIWVHQISPAIVWHKADGTVA
jgi:hypothetical protein